MTSSSTWHGLPRDLADVLEPELPQLSREIVRAIGHEVPQYMRPLEGAFGRGVRSGVGEALGRFLMLVRDPGSAQQPSNVYVALGHQEYRAGRTLDSLQSAYRVGARVAWRRLARAAHAAGVDQETVALLAEAIFAYIDELSADSVEGYARAQAERAGERERARAELLLALVRLPTPPSELSILARAARWALPRRVAALACPAEGLPGLGRRLGPEVLHGPLDRLGCVLVPDADGPGRRDAIRLAARRTRAALGPEGDLSELPRSWQLARSALSLASRAGELLVADELLGELLLREGASAARRIVERRLAGLQTLTAARRDRLALTALCFVQEQGNAAAMARALHVHPQTARYRIARLREVIGPQLDDPAARFELEAALRMLLSAQQIDGPADGAQRGVSAR